MADASIRDLDRKNRQIIDRVIAGEVLTITRGGRPVAPDALRRDIDRLIDSSS